MAIIAGDGTGMAFSTTSVEGLINSYDASQLNNFSVTVTPRTAALTGANIVSGKITVNYNNSSTSFPLSAINYFNIQPTWTGGPRFNQDSGCMEHYDSTLGRWVLGSGIS